MTLIARRRDRLENTNWWGVRRYLDETLANLSFLVVTVSGDCYTAKEDMAERLGVEVERIVKQLWTGTVAYDDIASKMGYRGVVQVTEICVVGDDACGE